MTLPTSSFGFESIIDSHHHHHHHHHHDQNCDDAHDPLASADISAIHATTSSSVAASNHLFLSLGTDFAASTSLNAIIRGGANGDDCGDSSSTPFVSTDQSPMNRAYCDIEVHEQ